ncbi:MAG: nucleoside deaminase [Oscillospiraceae bacterium]|nr:nucleoside deaminase [Oscillospiraceae bacterium]
MIKDDIFYMEKALSLAKEAAFSGEVPVGAVIVRNCDGFIAGTGKNTREGCHTALGHAEISAISEACAVLGGWRLSGCTLYVTLEPCPMCAGAVINARIDRVVFGAYDKKAGSCGSVTDLFGMGYNHAPIVQGGILENECTALLKDFFSSRRNKGKFSLSDIYTDDQAERAETLFGIPKSITIDNINQKYNCVFIRKKGKPVGYGVHKDGVFIKTILPSEYDTPENIREISELIRRR